MCVCPPHVTPRHPTSPHLAYFQVFNMGTTVLLQCYIADEEMFKDDPEGCYAPMTLKVSKLLPNKVTN